MAWDTSLRNHKTNRKIAELICDLYKCGQTRKGIEYTLGGVYVHEAFGRVSKKALEIVKRRKNGWPKKIEADRVKYYDKSLKANEKENSITIEHVVPVAAVYKKLNQMHRENRLDVDYIMRIMPKLYVALIAVSENDLLKKKYNSCMPDNWWESANLDPMDRYQAAGLGDDIWATEYDCLPPEE